MEVLTATEVAARLRVSRSTIYRWADDGTLPALRIGDTVRFRADDVAALVTPVEPQGAA